MTAAIVEEEKAVKQEIPEVFIIEYLNGMPLYYRGYKSIMDTPDKAEEIMGAGGIHSILLDFFYLLLAQHPDKNKYWRFSGESGIKLGKSNLLNQFLKV